MLSLRSLWKCITSLSTPTPEPIYELEVLEANKTMELNPPGPSSGVPLHSEKKGIFPFMRLAPELRVLIYAEALTRPSPLPLHIARKHSFARKRKSVSKRPYSTILMHDAYSQRTHLSHQADPINTALLSVSRLVYQEARAVLYKQNTLAIRLDTGIPSLSALHQQTRSHISSIELVMPVGYRVDDFYQLVRSLRYCFNLKTLTIVLPKGWHDVVTLLGCKLEPGNCRPYSLRLLPENTRVVVVIQEVGEMARKVIEERAQDPYWA